MSDVKQQQFQAPLGGYADQEVCDCVDCQRDRGEAMPLPTWAKVWIAVMILAFLFWLTSMVLS